MWKHRYQIFSISQYHLSDSHLAGLLHHFAQQRIRLFRNWTIGPCVVRRIVKRGRYFRRIDETHDVDSLGGFDLHFGDVVWFDDGVTVGFVLVALCDLIVGDDLAAFLAALVVADWTVVVAMELVKLDLFRGLDRVIDADGNRD